MSLPDFARLQYITMYTYESWKVGIPRLYLCQRNLHGLYLSFLRLDEITSRVTIRPSYFTLVLQATPFLHLRRVWLACETKLHTLPFFNVLTDRLTNRLGCCAWTCKLNCLHNVCMHVHRGAICIISGTLCMLLPFCVPFRIPVFPLSQLPLWLMQIVLLLSVYLSDVQLLFLSMSLKSTL